jgi:photosystem II stability/assembly factor-like uncharacterized protein
MERVCMARFLRIRKSKNTHTRNSLDAIPNTSKVGLYMKHTLLFQSVSIVAAWRRASVLLAKLLLYQYLSFAQLGWYWQNPLPQGNMLLGVSFTDANTGTAVGRYGTILRTTNGGASWMSQSSGTANTLWSVSFTDANTGTAVGEGGTIVRTTNGGASWVSKTSGTTNDLWGISFTDANTGTAVGYYGTII